MLNSMKKHWNSTTKLCEVLITIINNATIIHDNCNEYINITAYHYNDIDKITGYPPIKIMFEYMDNIAIFRNPPIVPISLKEYIDWMNNQRNDILRNTNVKQLKLYKAID